jgi:hypothetical protein
VAWMGYVLFTGRDIAAGRPRRRRRAPREHPENR